MLRKQRIEDVNVHCANFRFDFRISASREQKASPADASGTVVSERKKDRLSYRLGPWSFDLTRARSLQDGKVVTDTYEVEAELVGKASMDPQGAATCMISFSEYIS